MVTTLYLIRHGETEGGEPKRYKGHIDVPLSENGIKQMERLSEYIVQNRYNMNNVEPLNNLEQFKLASVYSSDLIRAVKSAEIIAKPYGLKPVIMPELRERNFGLWEGMSFDEIREKYPEEFAEWANNPLKFSPIQGESTIEVRDRVIDALNKILSNHFAEGKKLRRWEDEKLSTSQPLNISSSQIQNSSLNSIAIVSHGGVNRIIICHILGMPLENLFRIEQDYGALNIIEFWDKYPVVKLLNYV